MELDLHIHSKYSFDSLQTPNKIIKVAHKMGLDVIAITDHDTIRGGVEALKCDNLGLEVIVGSEITTDIGHMLCLFLNEEIKSKKAVEVIDEVKGQGGMTILAHPYKRKTNIPVDILKKVDAIEACNGRTRREDNLKAMNIARQYKIPVTAGSDAHLSFEIGKTKMILDSDNSISIPEAISTSSTQFYHRDVIYPKSLSRVIKQIKRKLL